VDGAVQVARSVAAQSAALRRAVTGRPKDWRALGAIALIHSFLPLEHFPINLDHRDWSESALIISLPSSARLDAGQPYRQGMALRTTTVK
jgi:hypothetical protein